MILMPFTLPSFPLPRRTSGAWRRPCFASSFIELWFSLGARARLYDTKNAYKAGRPNIVDAQHRRARPLNGGGMNNAGASGPVTASWSARSFQVSRVDGSPLRRVSTF